MKHLITCFILTIVALLSGCAVFTPPPGSADSTSWVKVAEPLPVRWEVVPQSEVAARCSFKYEHRGNACAIRLRGGPDGPYCLILAAVSFQEARAMFMYTPTGAVRTLNGRPETLADHELYHCEGYNHRLHP